MTNLSRRRIPVKFDSIACEGLVSLRSNPIWNPNGEYPRCLKLNGYNSLFWHFVVPEIEFIGCSTCNCYFGSGWSPSYPNVCSSQLPMAECEPFSTSLFPSLLVLMSILASRLSWFWTQNLRKKYCVTALPQHLTTFPLIPHFLSPSSNSYLILRLLNSWPLSPTLGPNFNFWRNLAFCSRALYASGLLRSDMGHWVSTWVEHLWSDLFFSIGEFPGHRSGQTYILAVGYSLMPNSSFY